MSGGVEFVYSGEEHHREVGVMMNSKMAKCMKGYIPIPSEIC